jgi:membrane-bound lytic murein transglycosylase D
VPVVPPSAQGAAVALGEPRGARGAAPNAAADATAARRAPARVFTHAPGVTWDLDVLPFEGHDRVQHYVAMFSGGARDRFGAWLSRGTRYEPMVRARLRAGGLPEDLYYLALVESGYDVHAFSRVGAAGMWQFMPETARELGMRLDWWVDERRDPVRATDAAVKMLRWLRGQFGSLFVAAAAYNGGPGRVSRGVALVAASEVATAVGPAADSAAAAVVAALDAARGGGDHPTVPNDAAPLAVPAVATSAPAAVPTAAVGEARFFALAEAGVIAAETRNYVPQLIAAALVGKEAARYGISVRREEPLAYDEVRVPGLTPLAAVAEATGSTRAELLDLNPHLLRGVTPPGGSYAVRVPEGARLPPAGDEEARAVRGARRARRRARGAAPHVQPRARDGVERQVPRSAGERPGGARAHGRGARLRAPDAHVRRARGAAGAPRAAARAQAGEAQGRQGPGGRGRGRRGRSRGQVARRAEIEPPRHGGGQARA